MLPHGVLPQELVDQIIGDLGDTYRDPDHDKRSNHRINACSLVSKNWTGRSRGLLFWKVNIEGDENGLFLIPPQPLMPNIQKLKIQLRCQNYRLSPSPDLLTPFCTAPVAYHGITGGVFPTEAQACPAEYITALSATLQTVTFKSCSLSLYMLIDVVLAHPGLKRLHLVCCDLKPTRADSYPALA